MLSNGLASNSINQLIAAFGSVSGGLFVSVFKTALSVAAQVPFLLQSMILYTATQNGWTLSTYIAQGVVAFFMIGVAVAFRNLFVVGLVALSLVGYVGGSTPTPTPVVTATAGP